MTPGLPRTVAEIETLMKRSRDGRRSAGRSASPCSLTPMIAAAAMSLSSVSVIRNALRLRRAAI